MAYLFVRMYGAYIKAARERAGWSRAQLAEKLGVGADMIGKVERDVTNLPLERLDRMAEAMGMRVGDLLPNSGASPVADRFEPLAAVMLGLPDAEVDELILNLAAQARILMEWRRRQPVGEAPQVPPRMPAPEPDEGERPGLSARSRVIQP